MWIPCKAQPESLQQGSLSRMILPRDDIETLRELERRRFKEALIVPQLKT
jgi:hypothetical protein